MSKDGGGGVSIDEGDRVELLQRAASSGSQSRRFQASRTASRETRGGGKGGLMGWYFSSDETQCRDLLDYEREPTLWRKQTPWNEKHIQTTAEEILQNSPVFGELSVINLSQMCSDEEGKLPMIVSTMLELVTWQDLALKTSAMEFLLRIFHLRTSFSRAIDATIFVTDDHVATRFYEVIDICICVYLYIYKYIICIYICRL